MKFGKTLRAIFSIVPDIARQLANTLRYMADRRNQPAVALGAALTLLIGTVFYLMLRYDHQLRLSGMAIASCSWTNDLNALLAILAGVVFGLFSFVSVGEVLVTLDSRLKGHAVNWRSSMLFAALAIGSGSLVLYLAVTNC